MLATVFKAYLANTTMTNKAIYTVPIMLLSCLSLLTCDKEEIEIKTTISYKDDFCKLVDKKDLDSTGYFIDEFLLTLKSKDQNENLEKLRLWLEEKECIDEAKILCNSCIKTLPLQSELSVSFVTDGFTGTMTMDILMADTLKFRAYH